MVMGCLQLNKRKHLLKKILSSQTSSKKKIRAVQGNRKAFPAEQGTKVGPSILQL